MLNCWIEFTWSIDEGYTSWIRYFTWVSKLIYLSQYYFKGMHENNGHAAEQREKSPDNSILNPWDSIYISFMYMHAPLTPLFVMHTYLRKRFFAILPLKTKTCSIIYIPMPIDLINLLYLAAVNGFINPSTTMSSMGI